METVDETPNIKELESKLSVDSIEFFIECLGNDIELIDDAINTESWRDYDINQKQLNDALDEELTNFIMNPQTLYENNEMLQESFEKKFSQNRLGPNEGSNTSE